MNRPQQHAAVAAGARPATVLQAWSEFIDIWHFVLSGRFQQ